MPGLSAEFSVEGSTDQEIHAVAYGATVDLALQSLTDVRTIQWSISSSSHEDVVAPTITPAGSPTGNTASFTMVADPADGQGRAVIVKCLLTGNSGATAVSTRKVSVANARGLHPLCVDEEVEASATHGWVTQINEMLAGSATLPSLVNPTDDGKIPYGLAGAFQLSTGVKVSDDGSSLELGTGTIAGAGLVRTAHNVDFWNGRSGGGGADVSLFRWGVVSETLGLGADTNVSAFQLRVATGGTSGLYFNGTAEWVFSASTVDCNQNTITDLASIDLGTGTLATTGLLNTAHNVTLWAGRTDGGGGNVSLARWGVVTAILGLGDDANVTGVQLRAATGGTVGMLINNNTEWSFSASNLDCNLNTLTEVASIGLGSATVASSGLINTAHNVEFWRGLSGGGGASVSLLRWGVTSEIIMVGENANVSGVQLRVATAGNIDLLINNNTEWRFNATSLDGDGNSIVDIGFIELGGGTVGTTGLIRASNSTASLLVAKSSGGTDRALLTWSGGTTFIVGNSNEASRFDGSAIGFFGSTPVTQRTVTGSKAGNAALTSLMTALAEMNLLVNSTS